MSSNLQSQLYTSLDSQNRNQATRIPDIHEQILSSSSSPDSQERQEQIVKLVTEAAKHEPQELFEYVQKSTDSYTRKYWTLKVIYILINGCHISEACETFTSIFDFICSEFSTAELDSDGKVLWLSVAKRLIRWEGCLYQKILDSSVCLLSSNEEETVIEVFMDFLYLIGQQENFTAHFSFFKKEKEQLLLVLCRLFRQTSGTNSEKKLLQNLQEKIKSSSDFIHFCKFLARQVDKEYASEAILLSVQIVGDYLWESSDNFLALLRALEIAAPEPRSCTLVAALATTISSVLRASTQKQKEKFLNPYSLSLLHNFVKSILVCEHSFPQKLAIFQDSIHFFKLFSEEKMKDICASVLSSDVILSKSDKSLALLTQLEKMYKDGESEVNIQSNIIYYLPLELNITVAANKIERFLTTMHPATISAQLSTDIFNFFQKRLQNGPLHPDSLNFKDFQKMLSLLLRIVSNTSFLNFSDVQHCYSIIHTFISTVMPICSISVHSSFTPEQHRLFITLMFTHLRKLTESKLGNHLQCAFPVVLEYLLQLSIKTQENGSLQNLVCAQKIDCYKSLLSLRLSNGQLSFDDFIFPSSALSKTELEKIFSKLLGLLHDEIALLSEPASAAAVSVDLIYNAVFFLKQALENHSLFCLLDKKTMQKVLLTFYSLSSSERSIEKTHVDCWKSYRLFLAENDTKDTHSLEDLTFLSLSAFGLLFSYEQFLPETSESENVLATFIRRLALACRPMLASESIKQEQRNVINFNTICLTSLKIAALELPTKYWKIRVSQPGAEVSWLIDVIFDYFRHKMARNWPSENIPWFLEFLIALIRRQDLCHIFTGEDLSNLATSKSNNYVHMFEIFAFFLNGDIDQKDTPSDQHMNITLAYTGVMKLFFRLAIEKRPRYLNLLISHGKTGLLYKSAIDRIENKVREKQSQNRRSSFGAKGKEEKEKLERKLKEDLAKLEKILYFNKDLVTTLRDVFKHNLLRNKPFAEENPVYEDFFKGAPTQHWIRGYNIHSISIPIKSCGVSFMEVIRKPAGMIRKYASIEGFANEVLTPECAYLWLYDNAYPRGRNPEDSLPVRATQPELLEQIDEHMPFSKVQVALVYVAPGQSSWADIFDNSSGSVRYTRFLEQLGDKVCLQRKGPEHNHAVSGLDFSRHGKFTYLHCDDISKIQFTVATVLPTNKDHQKLATIGNREIMVTWDESGGTYVPGTQDSDFPFVEIIISPVTSTIVKIDTALTSQFVSRKTRLPSKFKPFHKLSSSSQTEGDSFKSLEVGAAGGPIFLSDKNLPAAMISQVLNHSLTLSFTDSIRRVNHSDSYMEAMPSYHRLTLIQNIREKELQHQKSYLEKIGHHDDDFDLDYCL